MQEHCQQCRAWVSALLHPEGEFSKGRIACWEAEQPSMCWSGSVTKTGELGNRAHALRKPSSKNSWGDSHTLLVEKKMDTTLQGRIWQHLTKSYMHLLFNLPITFPGTYPGGSVVKKLPTMQVMWEMSVQSLGQKDPLEEEMATQSSILHGWRSLVGYSPWGRKQLYMTGHTHTQTPWQYTSNNMKMYMHKVVHYSFVYIYAKYLKLPKYPYRGQWYTDFGTTTEWSPKLL